MTGNGNSPKSPGWYWFLPDENCESLSGLLRDDKLVVVLVRTESYRQRRLVVQLGFEETLCTADMTGDWERITEPWRMKSMAMLRIKNKSKS